MIKLTTKNYKGEYIPVLINIDLISCVSPMTKGGTSVNILSVNQEGIWAKESFEEVKDMIYQEEKALRKRWTEE